VLLKIAIHRNAIQAGKPPMQTDLQQTCEISNLNIR
jgi:hypothetical protein